jgi:alkaline phosphatase D
MKRTRLLTGFCPRCSPVTLVGVIALLGCLGFGSPARPPVEPPRLTHGHASGDVTATTAIIWGRADRPSRLQVEYSSRPDWADVRRSETLTLTAESDFTGKIMLTGLTPRTRYFYRLRLGDLEDPSAESVGEVGTFVTAPAEDDIADLTFAYSGDSGEQYQPFRVFEAIAQKEPDFFLYLGDTIYSDQGPAPARTLEEYRRAYQGNRRDRALQRLLGLTSSYVIWDDHEVANDFNRTHPRIPIGRQAFGEYWPIGEDPQDPTRLYRSFRWGRLAELFILDCRQYRSPQSSRDDASKTMLGSEQKTWLKMALQSSPALFKFIATTVPLRYHTSDSWEGYRTERRELFDFIQQNDLRTIIFLSADVHYPAVINHPEGFKEVIVGPIAQFASPIAFAQLFGGERVEFAATNVFNYGLVRVRAGDPVPRVEISIFDQRNRLLHTTVVQ